jgi:putative ABC transport system permease protein
MGTKQITLQFIVEALVLIIVATILSIGLVYLIIPYFENFFDYTLSLQHIGVRNIVTLLIITLVFTTLLAGLYPAILFSRHKAIQVLNKSFTGLKSGSVFRQSLTIFQFTISIVLIASTFLIKNQLNYMLNKDLGTKKDNIMFLFFGDEIRDKMNSFSLEMNKISGVNSTCMTSQLPINVGALAGGLEWEGRKPNTERVFPYLAASYGLQQTYGIEVVKGRMFNNSEADINNYILNEEAIRIMQLENPIGKKFNMWGVNGRIVGVAKNFHHESLNLKIRPLLIANRPDLFNMVSLNLEGANIAETIKEVKKVWGEMCVGTPFDSHFVDDNFQRQYESYNRLKTMFTLLSIITIIISCIGLLGLTSFALQLRTKEIGVRRVNGANIIEMLKLLNGSFLKWVIVSCNLAIPITYFVLNLWLRNFAYKVGIDWSIFLFAGIITLLIAFFTISIHTYKAATRNPIEALRYE